jgi:hypothetical protein
MLRQSTQARPNLHTEMARLQFRALNDPARKVLIV